MGESESGPAVLGVIVPAFNEGATLDRVLRRVLLQPCVQQVVVVDDASTDGTVDVADRFSGDPRVLVLHHPVNRGKGSANGGIGHGGCAAMVGCRAAAVFHVRDVRIDGREPV